MIRWIRGSSRIEFFVFLIAWGIFFEWWELDLQLLPSSSSLLISRAESNHLLLAYILLLPLQVVLHSRSSHSSTVFSKPSSYLSSYLQISWSMNQTSSVSLGKKLVVQVDPWLNQQWSSWPWSSSSCVRLCLISIWNWNLSTYVGVQFIFFREII